LKKRFASKLTRTREEIFSVRDREKMIIIPQAGMLELQYYIIKAALM